MSTRARTARGTADIAYWLCITDTGELSPFQGFYRQLLESAPTLRFVATLPSSIFELYVERRRAIFGRIHGVSPYQIRIIDPTRLRGISLLPGSPFNVLVSNQMTVDATESLRLSLSLPVLHRTTAERSTVPQLESLDLDALRDLYSRVLSFLEASGAPEMELLPNPGTEAAAWGAETLELPELQHGVTIPNEMVLKSTGFRLAAGTPLPQLSICAGGSAIADANKSIIRALKQSVEAVRHQKSRIMAEWDGPDAGSPVDAVVWAASVASFWSDGAPPFEKAPHEILPLWRALVRQRDYPALAGQTPEKLRRVLSSAACLAAMNARKLELELCTAAVGVVAAGYFCPVIRVRPAVNLVKGRMRQLAACASSGGPHRPRKLSKLSRAIGQELAAEVGDDCMELIQNSGETIKLISNAPLELLPVERLPLQLRFTTSRLPVTPGNLLMNHILGAPSLYLSPADLRDVLIIRAFDAHDPIRRTLEKASGWFMDVARSKLHVKIVDVASPSEFADAIRTFTGQILIFDGHGSHGSNGEGTLWLGSRDYYPSELAGKIRRMPPIVVLSACTTHPLDWSEGSTATGFLALGAISVLATTTPILARDAAIFTGRLLLRVADFVPMIAGSGQRWSNVVTDLMRMSYVTDLLRSFGAAGLITDEDHRAIQYDANTSIGVRKKSWFEEALANISQRARMPLSEVEKFWQQNSYFTSTLQYVHLGSPDRIVIVRDDSEDWSHRAERDQ